MNTHTTMRRDDPPQELREKGRWITTIWTWHVTETGERYRIARFVPHCVDDDAISTSDRPRATPASHHLRQMSGDGIARYEALKADWIAANPDATPADYDQAMLRFARVAGV